MGRIGAVVAMVCRNCKYANRATCRKNIRQRLVFMRVSVFFMRVGVFFVAVGILKLTGDTPVAPVED